VEVAVEAEVAVEVDEIEEEKIRQEGIRKGVYPEPVNTRT